MISRVVRSHFLVQSALVTNLFKPFIDDGKDQAKYTEENVSVEDDEETVETMKTEDILRVLKNFTKYVKNEGNTTEDIKSKDYMILYQLENIVENYKKHRIKSSRTAKLWLLYVHYVDVKNVYSSWEIWLLEFTYTLWV